jgi:aminoglycoside phosphotransferase (APT) family kinase protein
LAATLADAGAELVDEQPEVEMGGPADMRGDAPVAIVVLGRWGGDASPRLVRAVKRAARSVGVRIQIPRVRGALHRLGYPSVVSIPWDLRHTLRLPGTNGAGRRRPVEYLPQRAVVVGRRGERERTVLDAALDDAGSKVSAALVPAALSVRSGLVSTLTEAGLLRVAVGPARVQIAGQLEALRVLRRSDVPPPVAERVPWPLADGRSGLGDWSLERRLAGGRPGALPPALEEQCVDFLVALHRCSPGSIDAFARERAELVADAAGREAGTLRALAQRLDGALSPLPAGFGHGDFFLGNMLVEDGRLTGVVDWDAAGPARPPLVDLIHLRHLAAHPTRDEDWGPSIVDHLLPWAHGGGDEVARGYCRRLGFEGDARTLEALALTYWLDRTAYQLRTHLHRRGQPRWLERNVVAVLQAVSSAT